VGFFPNSTAEDTPARTPRPVAWHAVGVPEAGIEDASGPVVVVPVTPHSHAPERGSDASERENSGVTLARFAWLVTTLICLVAALVALADGYHGYALVGFAVSISAGINLL